MNSIINQLTKLTLNRSSLDNLKLLKCKSLIINLNQKRNRGSTIRLIRGHPRPLQPFQTRPRPHDYRFRPILPPVSLILF